jgi:hypothetical protein
MAHPYFAPVRQREGFDARGNKLGSADAAPPAAAGGSGGGGG